MMCVAEAAADALAGPVSRPMKFDFAGLHR